MNATANELIDVANVLYEAINAQTQPVSYEKLKTTMFCMCRKVFFEDCVDFLVGVGSLQIMNLQVGERSEVIVATPATMQQFREKVQTTTAP